MVLPKSCRLPELPEGLLKLLTPCEEGVKLLVLLKFCRLPLPELPDGLLKLLTPCEVGVKLLVRSKFCRVSLPELPEDRLKSLLPVERGLIVLPSLNDLVRFRSEKLLSLPRISPVTNALESWPRRTTKESPLTLDL